MAKYLLLIYGDQAQWEAETPAEGAAKAAAHAAFAREAAGRILAAGELEPTPAATTLRTGPNGRLVTTDGPFLETKEAVGGFYLLEAADRDEVLTLAARLPEVHAGHRGVEVRPLAERG
jgi:hypothetical protein